MGALQLVESSFVEDKNIRDKYINKIEAMEKVKILSLLPNGEHMTIKMVAEYYEVDKKAIDKVVLRNSEELESDGMRLLKDNEAMKFNTDNLSVLRIPRKMVTVIPRRAILRIGMLLRDSEVAKEIRTYLLNVEEAAPPELKVAATKRRIAWTAEEDMKLLDYLHKYCSAGHTPHSVCEMVGKKIGRTTQQVYSRYSNKIKPYYGQFLERVNSTDAIQREIEDSTIGNIEKNTSWLKTQMYKVYDEIKINNVKFAEYNNTLRNESTKLKLQIGSLEADLRIKDILLMDKDRQIELLLEKHKQELDDMKKKSDTYKKKYNEFKSSVEAAKNALSGVIEKKSSTRKVKMNDPVPQPTTKYILDESGLPKIL